jgi:hypothetical protein
MSNFDPQRRMNSQFKKKQMNTHELKTCPRAQITAMLLRVISELAGGDPGLDLAVSEVCSGVIEVCYGSKVEGSPEAAEAAMQAALGLVTDSNWRLTITKTRQLFELEARFGDESQTGDSLESVHGNC